MPASGPAFWFRDDRSLVTLRAEVAPKGADSSDGRRSASRATRWHWPERTHQLLESSPPPNPLPTCRYDEVFGGPYRLLSVKRRANCASYSLTSAVSRRSCG